LLSTTCHGALLVASMAWGIINPTIHLGSSDAAGGGGMRCICSSVAASTSASVEPMSPIVVIVWRISPGSRPILSQ